MLATKIDNQRKSLIVYFVKCNHDYPVMPLSSRGCQASLTNEEKCV